ncbi:MAG TPA: bluetail domain-containing putative surface protein, partial [Rhizomicrobium sp.]|nr:bluetail domain-containing putative surface protein [Rhizomicrobium sp.]
VGFNLGTLSFSNVENLDLRLGGISATAAQLSAFTSIYTTDGTADVSIGLTGLGGTIDFGALWHGKQTLHIDAYGAGDGTGYTLTGTSRSDIIAGSDYTDTISGGGGNDILNTRDGIGDVLNGDDGSDELTTYATDVTLNGGNGKDRLFSYSGGFLNGDAGDDKLIAHLGAPTSFGGEGRDRIFAATGSDTFVYTAATESSGADHDTIRDTNFANDIWDLAVAVTGIDATITTGTLDKGVTFDAGITAAADAAHLAANHAVLFTPDGGDRAGSTFLIVDLNGTAGYQSGQDLVIKLADAQNIDSFATTNFA